MALDPPFMVPIEAVLDLPPPPSVNKTRRVDWANKRVHDNWIKAADMSVMARGGMRHLARMPAQFEAMLVLNEQLNDLDLDNSIKTVIDYARRLKVVIDDSKRFMRRVTIEWGDAPTGCRLTLRSIA